MVLEGLDLTKVSTLVSQQIDNSTCLECCKYYIAPETAGCGHTLCHTCWRGRRSCPACTSILDKKSLKLNAPLQTLTEHVHALSEAFENLFNVKIDEFTLDEPVTNTESDTTKHVKEWLASSQNHFSAPGTSSQQSIHEVLQNIELSKSKIQIHAKTEKKSSLDKVVIAPQPQDDWDKVEVLPSTEELLPKCTDVIVGPMDIEPFIVEEEYTSDQPRRSLRKKDVKQNESSKNISLDNQNSHNSIREAEKKVQQAKQNWSNVKKMRKEFSKLNKQNRNRLNVSIEMCKQTHSVISSKPQDQENSESLGYIIDDNTQTIIEKQQNLPTENKSKKTKNADTLCLSQSENRSNNNDQANNVNQEIEEMQIEDVDFNVEKSGMQKSVKNNEQETSSNNDKLIKTECFKIPFVKKSTLNENNKEIVKRINVDRVNNNTVPSDTDDVEITIKIGSTITNIIIKKKQKDVQLKVCNDQEIQTSLGPHLLCNKSTSYSPKTNVNAPYFEINVGNNHEVSKVVSQQVSKCLVDVAGVNSNKSSSTKKHTASADTVTAQYEITESVEKELSNIMEEIEEENLPVKKASHPQKFETIRPLQDMATKIVYPTTLPDIPEDSNSVDADIFASGSVKESNVQFLKSTKQAPSEILLCTVKTTNPKITQKHSDKRERDSEDDALPTTKKIKITNKDNQDSLREASEGDLHKVQGESENYDAIMGQVFANIDADIEEIQKTQNKNMDIDKTQSQRLPSQSKKANYNVANVHKVGNQQYSENVFTAVEKEDLTNTIHKEQVPGPETQKRIDDLLTPGMCHGLESTVEDMEVINVQSTPMIDNDDSDKSVVEETPQKSVSFSKMKQKNENVQETSQRTTSIESRNAETVVNFAAAARTSEKERTVTENENKKLTMETPQTINNFFDEIKHKSTPFARKSLNFANENVMDDNDIDQTLCPSTSQIVRTTQEKEIMAKAFERTQNTPTRKPLAVRNIPVKENRRLVIAGSCLAGPQISTLKRLCLRHNWQYVDKYSKDLTHLVVDVDEENKSQRSVKYMCALAAGKWIVSFAWVERSMQSKEFINEEPYEVLDSTGDPGPMRSRLSKNKLFEGITFFCMPPYTVLDVDTLKSMLEAAGGHVVNRAVEVRAMEESPALLLAEPEHTQEDRFTYLAMELSIVPVNYEWALNCLGSYTLGSIHELLLCPSSLLPKATIKWPSELLTQDD